MKVRKSLYSTVRIVFSIYLEGAMVFNATFNNISVISWRSLPRVIVTYIFALYFSSTPALIFGTLLFVVGVLDTTFASRMRRSFGFLGFLMFPSPIKLTVII